MPSLELDVSKVPPLSDFAETLQHRPCGVWGGSSFDRLVNRDENGGFFTIAETP